MKNRYIFIPDDFPRSVHHVLSARLRPNLSNSVLPQLVLGPDFPHTPTLHWGSSAVHSGGLVCFLLVTGRLHCWLFKCPHGDTTVVFLWGSACSTWWPDDSCIHWLSWCISMCCVGNCTTSFRLEISVLRLAGWDWEYFTLWEGGRMMLWPWTTHG